MDWDTTRFAVALAMLALACAATMFAPTLRRAARPIELGERGIETGVLLFRAPRGRGDGIVREAAKVADSGGPRGCLSVWMAAGARPVAHLPGPVLATPPAGRQWVTETSDRLASRGVDGYGGLGARAVFALVYASERRLGDVGVPAVLGDFAEAVVAIAMLRCSQPVESRTRRWMLAGAVSGVVLGAGILAASSENVVAIRSFAAALSAWATDR